jgi:hypothetical protein
MYFDLPNTAGFVPSLADQPRGTVGGRGCQLRQATADLFRGHRAVQRFTQRRIVRGAITDLVSDEYAVRLHAVSDHQGAFGRLTLSQVGAFACMAVAHRARLAGIMGNYPNRRQPFYVYWRARAGCSVDHPPFPTSAKPATVARDRGIRKIFFDQFHGIARLDDVGAAAEDAGVLDDLRTPRSMREAVLKALRPIATLDGGAAPQRPGPVTGRTAIR